MAKYFSGIMVPVMTPFDQSGKIAEAELDRHIRFLVDAGVHSLLVPSGTGEFANLTFEQKELVTRTAVKAAAGKVPVVSLVSDCSTENVLKLCELAKKCGAAELMLTPPYYSHVDQRALLEFFTLVADRCDLPLWLYHQPGETKLTIEPETVLELAKHPNIVGIKVAAGDDFFYFCRLRQMLRANDDFSVLMGEDFATLPSYVMGGDGSVSSLANVTPKEFVEIFDAYRVGDLKRAQALQERIMDIFAAMVMVDTGAYQSACKTVLREMGLYSTNLVSSPFVSVLPEEEAQIIAKAKALGVI